MHSNVRHEKVAYSSREIARMRKNIDTTRNRVAAAEAFLNPRKNIEVMNSWFAKEKKMADNTIKEESFIDKKMDKKKDLTELYNEERKTWVAGASPQIQLRQRLEAKKRLIDEAALEKKRELEMERLEVADELMRSKFENTPEVRETRRLQKLAEAARENQKMISQQEAIKEEENQIEEIPILVGKISKKHRFIISLRPSEIAPRLSTPNERGRLEKALNALDTTAQLIHVKLTAAPGGRFGLDLSLDTEHEKIIFDAILGLPILNVRKIQNVRDQQRIHQMNREQEQEQKLKTQNQNAHEIALAHDRRQAEEVAQRAMDAIAQKIQEEALAFENKKQIDAAKAAKAAATARRQELAIENERRQAQRVAQKAAQLQAERQRIASIEQIENEKLELAQKQALAEAQVRRLEYQHCLALARHQQQLENESNRQDSTQRWEFWQDHDQILNARRIASRRLQDEVIASWSNQNIHEPDTQDTNEIAFDEAAIRAELWAAKARENARKLLAQEHFAAYVARAAQRDDEIAATIAEDQAKLLAEEQHQRQLKAHVAATLGDLPQHRLPPELRDTSSHITPRDAAAIRRQQHFELAAGRPSNKQITA